MMIVTLSTKVNGEKSDLLMQTEKNIYRRKGRGKKIEGGKILIYEEIPFLRAGGQNRKMLHQAYSRMKLASTEMKWNLFLSNISCSWGEAKKRVGERLQVGLLTNLGITVISMKSLWVIEFTYSFI
ncbi:hypothetical protein AVEN_136665-1 [Araneus ventricosus]|uniref:Uncharacterized protein n=1 Tax=Araneus ventricosus TaxID=182803 RepID=A0A4Y2SRL9_ARAVE|nr:hypothetical protein AVEN_136665-1 [Araneus ventricosus]